MKTSVAFVHTSPAAIAPVMRFYSEAAPDWEVTNLLDDGILRFLSAGSRDAANERLRSMIDAARDVYSARAVLITCSSVSTQMVEALAPAARIPLIKIDDPMAVEAVNAGRRIGVAITFAPTTEPTQRLLHEAAVRQGREVELVPLLVDGAYDALLGGRPEHHDALLFDGLVQLEQRGVDAIVLAQVSMARILPLVQGKLRVPVLSSVTSSLGAMRRALGA